MGSTNVERIDLRVPSCGALPCATNAVFSPSPRDHWTGLARHVRRKWEGEPTRALEFLIQIQRVLERYDTSKQQDPYRDGTPACRRKGSLARDPKELA
jgi:hypothetical protein